MPLPSPVQFKNMSTSPSAAPAKISVKGYTLSTMFALS